MQFWLISLILVLTPPSTHPWRQGSLWALLSLLQVWSAWSLTLIPYFQACCCSSNSDFHLLGCLISHFCTSYLLSSDHLPHPCYKDFQSTTLHLSSPINLHTEWNVSLALKLVLEFVQTSFLTSSLPFFVLGLMGSWFSSRPASKAYIPFVTVLSLKFLSLSSVCQMLLVL